MKIVGFAQLRNELSKQNLKNWLRQMFEMCEYVYVYDQNSDDGSKELYLEYPKLKVIYSETNDFKNEIICKQVLLEKLLSEQPDTDFIFWLDGDALMSSTLTDNNNEVLYTICDNAIKNDIDGILFEHYNLWRSDLFYRVDNNYHDLSNGVCALWRNNGKLAFRKVNGLHQQQFPMGIGKVMKVPIGIIHRGFATDYQIITKYNVYKANGQSGWALDRLLDETTLEVVELDKSLLPKWFDITQPESPLHKEKIINIYNNQ